MPSIESPNIENYVLAGGALYFKPEGGGEYLHLGHATVFQTEQEIERLDHFSRFQGKRVKDRSDVQEHSMTLNIELEEWTPQVLGMALMGTPAISDGDVSIDIGSHAGTKGAMRWVGNNEGPSWTLDFPSVTIAPDGEIDFISDEWAAIPLTAEVLFDQVNGRFGVATANFTPSPVPVNQYPPQIIGEAQEDAALASLPGVWTNNPTAYAYQWQEDDGGDGNFVDIVGATEATFTPATANVGNAIRLQVIASNSGGESDPAYSPATEVVTGA